MSVLLPASAWCSNVFGRKKFFLGCLTTFGLASFICGIAPNFQIMIAARVIQGLSGGPLFPLSQAILLESFPKSEHGKAMAAFGMCVVLAPVVGPILGGYLTSTYSWNWVFFISIPFIVIGGIMVSLYVEDPPYMQAMKNPPKIDILGFLLLIIWSILASIPIGGAIYSFVCSIITGDITFAFFSGNKPVGALNSLNKKQNPFLNCF